MLLTVNISSVASAIPDESLEPESNVLIVHNHSSSLSRERIEKNGLDAPYGKLYFEFIPGITKENIPEKHVAVEVHSGNTLVYNGSFYEGFYTEDSKIITTHPACYYLLTLKGYL